MFKFIIGGIIGAAIVAACYAGKIDNVENEKESIKRKYDEEKQRRKASDNTAEKYKTENFMLKDKLESASNRNSSTKTTQDTYSVSKSKTVHIKPETVVHTETEINKTDEETIRCIRL